MSTRCIINFCSNKNVHAKVYRHSDGYPIGEYGVLQSLRKFYTQVELETNDTRFSDPSYLAAKFVVWQADQYAKTNKLDFLSVGVCVENPGDIDYEYFVDCSTMDSSDRPMIGHKKAYDYELED